MCAHGAGLKQDSPPPRQLRGARRLATAALLGLIRAYQLALSPWLGRQCRFVPTCSAYAFEAVESYGPIRGSWLALARIARCRPGGGFGYDPVPESPAEN